MEIVSADTRRTTTTPNATMTTLASPTQGGATHPVWLVAMNPHAEGPLHAFEAEVVWSLTEGRGSLRTGGREQALETGDTVVLAPDEPRQFVAGAEGFTAVVTTVAPGRVTRCDGGDSLVPEWVA